MSTIQSGSRLTQSACLGMESEFLRFGHKPSAEMIRALRDIQETLTSMAFGYAQNKYFLSSVDPGVGKSTAVSQWLRSFLKEDDLQDTGVIICLDRYDQIRRFIIDSGLPHDRFSVYATDSNELTGYGLGKANATEAQILIATKAQIYLKSRDRLFADIREFHYRGRPRQVRYWDEAFVEGKPLTLPLLSLGSLLPNVAGNPTLMSQIDTLLRKSKTIKNGETVEIPTLCMSLAEALELFRKKVDAHKRDVVETLWLMSGKTVTVRISNKRPVLVDCCALIPADFMPCLITDASGRVRETYRFQEIERGNLVRLKSAVKDYSRMSVLVWRKGGGKSAYSSEKSFSEMVREIAAVIDSEPDKDFLVVHHLSTDLFGKDDIESAVLRRIKRNADRVSFLNYGRHTSTNDFSHVDHVILAGTQFYDNADYEALGRAAANRPTSMGQFTSEETRRVKDGESAHHLLQAVCRGSIRRCDSTDFTLWLIADPRTGVERLLPIVFPHCKVNTWRTSVPSLKGKRLDAYNAILKWLESGEEEAFLTPMLNDIGVRGPSDFKRDIMNSTFRDTLDQLGVTLVGERRKMRFIRKRSSAA